MTIVVATAFVCFFLFPFCVKGQVVINEIMQSNVDCVIDELNEFPDSWVELYNSDDKPVALHSYQIGVTGDTAVAWQLPDTILEAKQFVLVKCDKEANGMHTDFRLETSKGGSLFLFCNGVATDSITNLAKQPAPNISYGRKIDAAREWGYQYRPTPGFANCGMTAAKLLGQPVFSHHGMVLQSGETINLDISMPEDTPDSAVIRYTIDGSEPAQNSSLYTQPIAIDSTTVVRAKLFCEGCLSPLSISHSFIFLNRKQTLPVVSLVTDSRYLWDDTLGIYVEGAYSKTQKNFNFNWRRPVNIELFENGDTASVINQLCEMRVHGGATRVFQLKSLKIYAHKRFGNKRLKYVFFPEQKPGMDDFKSIVLRNAGNDYPFLYLRDAIIQGTMGKHTDIDYEACQPAIVFFNGQYMGMLNIRERSDDDFIYANYNGLEDVDVVEDFMELEKGDGIRFRDFMDFYSQRGHTYEEYEQWMDCNEFINYMIMNLFFNNQDFPGNNFVAWRPRTSGGRFRFIAHDTDFGMGYQWYPANYETIKWFYSPGFDSTRSWGNIEMYTRLFRHAMEDSTFRDAFIEKCSIYMGDFLNSRGVHEVWDKLYDKIRQELPFHIAAQTMEYFYDSEVDFVNKWLLERPKFFYKQLGEFYGLGSPVKLDINNSPVANDSIALAVNGWPMSYPSFDGMFFPGRKLNVGISYNNTDGFLGWRIVENYNDSIACIEKGPSEMLELTVPECAELHIDPLFASKIVAGDFNCDGLVNVTDVMILIGELLNTDRSQWLVTRDLNHDGKVNIIDVMTIVGMILNAKVRI